MQCGEITKGSFRRHEEAEEREDIVAVGVKQQQHQSAPLLFRQRKRMNSLRWYEFTWPLPARYPGRASRRRPPRFSPACAASFPRSFFSSLFPSDAFENQNSVSPMVAPMKRYFFRIRTRYRRRTRLFLLETAPLYRDANRMYIYFNEGRKGRRVPPGRGTRAPRGTR
jgi:hypothetical protein